MEFEEKRQFQRMQLSSQLQFRRIDETQLFERATMELGAFADSFPSRGRPYSACREINR